MTTKAKTIIAILVILLAGAVFYAVSVRTAVAPVEENGGGGTETSSPLVKLTTPRPNTEVQSPLLVKGEARGNWYFEASFPVRLLDGNGKELIVVPAQAQGEWMTTEFVPFEVTLTFGTPETETGTLILEKDNPSGLPEHADEVRIPVRFKSTEGSTSGTSGVRGIVTIGPTCPVVQYPPDGACDDKPYQAQFKITKKNSLFSKTVSSGADGILNTELSPGNYTIALVQQNVMPSMSPMEFTVTEGKITEISLSLDSGIR